VKDELIKTLQIGVNLSNEDKFDEAIKEFDKIAELYNAMVQALIQRGRSHWEMKRWDLATEDFNKAQAMDPTNMDIPWTMALMNLQKQNFSEGWKTFDLRWESKKFDSPRLKTNKPQWRPHRAYKDLLVWSEQGVGDQILYCSLLRHLKNHVPELTVLMDARLIPLFKRSFSDIQFVPQNARVWDIDSQIPMGSIAKELIPEMSDIPEFRADPYLVPDYARASAIRADFSLKPGEKLVGISWASGAPRIGNHKSAPLPDFLPLFQIPNTRFVSLQYGDHYAEMFELEKTHGIRIEQVLDIDNTQDLDGLAALITACDVVVTVSNATGHLAGAVGAKTFLLDSNKLWYWNSCVGKQNLWYPSVTTYPKDNAIAPWTPQITALTEDVKAHLFAESPVSTFVFFRTGTEEELAYTKKFVASLRASNPNAEIIMCTDRHTPEIEGVTRRFELTLDTDNWMEYRLQIYAELRLTKPAMYLDDDMIVQAAIDPKKLLGNRKALLCERSFGRDLYFNTQMKGLDFYEHKGKKMHQVYPYLACATVTENYLFWADLLFIMDRIHPKYRKWYGDQECMRIWKQTASQGDYGVLSEADYACLPEELSGRNPKIIHYKGSRKSEMLK
jgi:ADP-heptose:LPS heptosyltransferase